MKTTSKTQKGIVRAAAALVLPASIVAAVFLAAMAGSVSAQAAGARRAGAAAKSAAAAESGEKAAPVDINTADVEKLTGLPGVGPAIAQRIVDYRKEHGSFKSVDELLSVRGIGERSLARLRDRVTVGAKD